VDPDGLYPVLNDVFNLSKDVSENLKRLLSRTSLTRLVTAFTQVANRLDFLAALLRPGLPVLPPLPKPPA
jgi:hypothetical protein